MASTYKTNLGFNKWLESDKPRMEDFNRDNELVEDKIQQLIQEKVSKSIQVPWTNITMLNDYQSVGDAKVMVDECGWVHIQGRITKASIVTRGEVFAQLPNGIRPTLRIAMQLVQNAGNGGNSWCTMGWVNVDGTLSINGSAVPGNFSPSGHLVLSVVFKTA